MHFGRSDRNCDLWRRGLAALKEQDLSLHPKLQKLNAHLRSSQRETYERSARYNGVSFFDFIGGKNKGVNQVMGQDLHDADIYELNNLLKAANMATIKSSFEFKLQGSIGRLDEIHRQPPHTSMDLLLNAYYETALRRITATEPINLKEEHGLAHKCDICGKAFRRDVS